VLAHVPEEVDVREVLEPVGVVDDDGGARPLEAQEFFDDLADACEVFLKLRII